MKIYMVFVGLVLGFGNSLARGEVVLEGGVGVVGDKQDPPYQAKMTGERDVLVEDVSSEKVVYEVKIPTIGELSPALDRGFPGFGHAVALASGDLLVRYYESTDFLYVAATKKWCVMPAQVDGSNVQLGGWVPLSARWLYAPVHNDEESRIAVYDMQNREVQLVNIPRWDAKIPVMALPHDWVQGIVSVREFRVLSPGHPESDIEFTGKQAWYRVGEKKERLEKVKR